MCLHFSHLTKESNRRCENPTSYHKRRCRTYVHCLHKFTAISMSCKSPIQTLLTSVFSGFRQFFTPSSSLFTSPQKREKGTPFYLAPLPISCHTKIFSLLHFVLSLALLESSSLTTAKRFSFVHSTPCLLPPFLLTVYVFG